MSLPELQQNPLVQRVIDIFDTDGNGEVDFKGTQITVFTQRHYRNKLLNHNEACPSLFSACCLRVMKKGSAAQLRALIVLLIAEFIEGVSQFSVKGDKEQKLRCK